MGPEMQQMGGNDGGMIVSSGNTVGTSSTGGGLSRGMILAVAATVVVLIGGVVGLVIYNNSQNGGENGSGTNSRSVSGTGFKTENFGTVRQEFNEYANYVLTGSATSASVNVNVAYNKDRAIARALNASTDEKRTYFKELQTHWVNFLSVFQDTFGDMDTSTVLSDNSDYVEYLRLYAEAGISNQESITRGLGANSDFDVDTFGDVQSDALHVVNALRNINMIITREGVE